jgi:hypothetical protein
MKAMLRCALMLGAALTVGSPALAQQSTATGSAPDGVKAAEKIPVDSLPSKVRATVLREAGSKDVEWVAPEKQGGRTVYRAELNGNGKIVQLVIRGDGSIVSRTQPGMASRRPHHVHQPPIKK